MVPASRVLAAAAAGAVLLGAAPLALARPLLAPAPGGVSLPGIAEARRLTLDRGALATLRRGTTALVSDFPLARGRSADLVLERFEPFAPGARAEIVEADGPRALALPDQAYFRGAVAGDPGSRVLLVAGARRVHGFVATDGDVHAFGPDPNGGHRVWALRDVDRAAYPPPGDFCVNDLVPEAVAVPDVPPAMPAPDPFPAAEAPATLRQADVAIETDQELRAKFPSDAAALEYLASLAAAATAVYERDVAVRLRFSYIRLWGASPADPWSGTSPGDTLSEVRAYWNNPANGMGATAGPRTVVHFVSGKSVQGGVAYVNVLCNASFGYGVSQVYGAFDLASPWQIWDVLVFTHELGHNFGSPHSHCYSPPVDQCYNAQSGCYAGPVVASRGTIMSYCHLLAGGLSNIDLLFGGTVSDRIGQSVAAASCLATVSVSTTTTSSSTTSTTSTSSTTTRPPTTTSTSTTSTTAPTVTTSSSTTSTTAASTTSTSSTSPSSSTSSTSSTTLAPPPTSTSTTSSTTTTTLAGAGDGDGDGVRDARDRCPDTPSGDLVDNRGCTLCPCEGPITGGAWASHASYLRCVRAEGRALLAGGGIGRHRLRTAVASARRASCGLAAMTRCCVVSRRGRARCRVLAADACADRAVEGLALDVGPGSCASARCTP